MENVKNLDAICQEKINTINEALLDFVLRVATDSNAKPEEIQALPEVAKVVLETLRPKTFICDYGLQYGKKHSNINT